MLLTIRQKSWEPSFWEKMHSFVSLAYASLAASRSVLQQLLACLSFNLDSEDLSIWYKRKKWFLWTVAAGQAAGNHGAEWGLTWYFWWGIYTSIPTWTYSQNSRQQQKHWVERYPPMEHLSNDHEDRPIQRDYSHKQYNETENMMESQWKLRLQHNQNIPMEWKPFRTNTSISGKKEI